MSASKPREVYLAVHALPSCTERSNCPHYAVVQLGREPEITCVSYCKATNRYLTRSSVAKCAAYWTTCPFKQSLDLQLA
ncbi:MAG: hypothetical protein QXW94_06460 [Desulfurococcaceae archaeon]